MDPKASAKSKRSHSQHGRKSHPTPSAPGSHKNKKPTPVKDSEHAGDQKPKPPRPSRPSLPSNWDRYEENYELEAEQQKTAVTAESQKEVEGGGDTIPVKSKGADFRYLIEQARSQPQDVAPWNVAESENPASIVNVPEHLSGLGSMLLARGQSLLLSDGDDNFFVDDNPTTSLEIPFLSLDLNALAAQLAKLKASERLFVEPEYIPEELESETRANFDETGNKSSSADAISGAREGSSGATGDFAPGSYIHSAWSNKEKEKIPLTPFKGDDASVSNAQGKTVPSDSHHGSAIANDPFGSELSAAKADFDALLDSLGEFKISSSSGFGGQLSSNQAQQTEAGIRSTDLAALPPSSNLSFMNRGMKASDPDDTIDDLLSESLRFVPSYNTEAKSNIRGELKQTFADADSVMARRFPGTPSLDDSIDDLLAETSSFKVRKDRKSSLFSGEGTQHSMKDSSASAIPDTLSKALDDLDSLLDM